MAIEIFNRQELKFLINQKQFKQIYAGLAPYMIPDKHNKNGQTYTIYNLYIDTDDHALIRHSLSKPTYKEKIRIRSYEEFRPDTIVFLEVKKRLKRITNKRRTKILYDEALEFVESGKLPCLHDYMNTQVVEEFKTMLSKNQYIPKTFVTYDRLAFSAKDKSSDLRVTFDKNLRTRRFNHDKDQLLLEPDRMIMEVKSSHNIPLWLVEILSSNNINKQSYSKYGQEYLKFLRTNKLTNEEDYA